jgi:DNA ligase (NAD+)
MRELVEKLNRAGDAYYGEDKEILSNLEYDELYDELVNLENEMGTVLSNSPTVKVGGEIAEFLPKELHHEPMLSLNKTKDLEDLSSWLGDQEGILSWKLDGLTIVLTYEDGRLMKAVTRGNGEVGEVITNNAKQFSNLPMTINFPHQLVIRGEAIIKYSDFERINQALGPEAVKYKNPRNLCSGSVRQLNPKVTKRRHVHFYAFALVKAQGLEFDKREEELLWLSDKGFSLVEYKKTGRDRLKEDIDYFAREIVSADLPSDGLVLIYNDIGYGKKLGATSKFPKDAMAFKWRDEIAETILRKIEWNASRTGLINPIAVFDPVELEGTSVKRASVHNLSLVRELKLAVGDRIKVYKANMIIPQILENLTPYSQVEIPTNCPACGGEVTLRKEKEVELVLCENPECPAKNIKAFTLLVSRNALNIEGLSEATVEKWIDGGLLHEPAELFELGSNLQAREAIINMEGFGEKSYENLIKSIEKARTTTGSRLLYGLGIPGIGASNAKLIAAHVGGNFHQIMELNCEELLSIPGVGPVMAEAYVKYFHDSKNRAKVNRLLDVLILETPTTEGVEKNLQGKVFVITGSLEHFDNRDELKDYIEQRGGSVTGSVSAKTDFLINNDLNSPSSKNKSAKALDVKIITEQDFLGLASS